jgi:hypothetical protein
MAGTWASETTPFFERLCPAMTVDQAPQKVGIASLLLALFRQLRDGINSSLPFWRPELRAAGRFATLFPCLFFLFFAPVIRLFGARAFSYAISTTFPVFGARRRPVNRLYFSAPRFFSPRFIAQDRQKGEPSMRFQPGQSGNPAGRPPGSRNTRTIIAEKLLDDSAGEVTRAAIKCATDGDPAALRACLDRIVPRLRHRPLDFTMPELVTLADTPGAINAIAQGLARGELDRDEAAALMRAVREFTLALAAVKRDKGVAPAARSDDDDGSGGESLADFLARRLGTVGDTDMRQTKESRAYGTKRANARAHPRWRRCPRGRPPWSPASR